jgi:hypothetical protein
MQGDRCRLDRVVGSARMPRNEVRGESVVTTVFHLHAGFQNNRLIRDYYRDCGIEPIGPYNDMKVQRRVHVFSTIRKLLENLNAEKRWNYHLIVSHGRDDQGLLVNLMPGSSARPLKSTIDDLNKLADYTAKLSSGQRTRYGMLEPVEKLRTKLGLTTTSQLESLIDLVLSLRNKKRVISVRGCNIGKNRPLLRSYKKFFNAARFMAPTCRDLFLQIRPNTRPNSAGYMNNLAARPVATAALRRRVFRSPNPVVESLVVDIQDIDGHSQVAATSYIQDPNDVTVWARLLNGEYARANGEFVLEVMWENSERTYHTPRQREYTDKIAIV